MLQTASGALNEVINMSYRMHELMTSCSNGTNTSSDIKSYDDELTALIKEIDDIKEKNCFLMEFYYLVIVIIYYMIYMMII
ncbi:MAG: hypothetical protein L6V81_02430 [Clostridium sp.]|nr:MAG: hypothetical protein L6V81_02430 [Clostridium sp.]